MVMAIIILTPWDWGSPWSLWLVIKNYLETGAPHEIPVIGPLSTIAPLNRPRAPGFIYHGGERRCHNSDFSGGLQCSLELSLGIEYFPSHHLLWHWPAPSAFTKDRHLDGSIIIPTNKITMIMSEFTMVIIIMTTMVTWSGSPPKYSMLSLTQTKASSWSLRPWEWPSLMQLLLLMMMLVIDDDNIDTMVRDSSKG